MPLHMRSCIYCAPLASLISCDNDLQPRVGEHHALHIDAPDSFGRIYAFEAQLLITYIPRNTTSFIYCNCLTLLGFLEIYRNRALPDLMFALLPELYFQRCMTNDTLTKASVYPGFTCEYPKRSLRV